MFDQVTCAYSGVRILSALLLAIASTGCMEQEYGITGFGSTSIAAAQATPAITTPSPTPVCTQTCTVSNGVGVQSCGLTSADTCTLTQCNSGYVVYNGACIPATSVTNFACTSYEQLALNPTNNQLVTQAGGSIPAQEVNGSGKCYYYPIVVETTPLSGSSYLTGTAAEFHDQSVLARDHDVNSSSATTVWHPYSMAHTNVNFTMLGARVLNITGGGMSGNTFNVQNVDIDNFFLIGVYPQSSSLTPANLQSYYSAWGTGDSVIYGLDHSTANTGIAFNPSGIDLATNGTNTYPDGSTGSYSSTGATTNSSYAIIPLNSEASGGTAHVPEVSISNLITPNVSTTIDFRALDCGSGRALSSIYLLVQ